MATVYAVANQKGGVGKTTTAVNMAACVAEAGYRTLLVDLDPQCNATVGARDRQGPRAEHYTCLLGADDSRAAARPTGDRHAGAGPVDAGSRRRDGRAAAAPARSSACAKRSAPRATRFDQIVLDCPPSLGPLSVNALVAADRVIVPVQAEYLALEGLAQFLDTLALIQRELNPRLEVAGMLLTMYDGRTRLAQDVERELREHFPALVFRTVIPRNVRVERGAELRPAGDPPRPALRGRGRVLRACKGGR